MNVNTILISQPNPTSEKSPYFSLAEKLNLKIDFRPFIHVEGISAVEFRKQRINILDHTAIILTSRNAVDHFFSMCEKNRVTVPDSMKYFCVAESIALYLQKYVLYRKRKIFHGKQRFVELMDIINKHADERFFVPCSDIHKQEIPELLKANNINFSLATLYRTIASDLSDLTDVNYDMLVFFSPSGIESLLKNFPNFKQNNTKIACFGTTTANAVKNNGLRVDVVAPMPQVPSMSMAIEQFIKKNKNVKI